ncbi:hypothetical protein SEA_MOLIVIA_33 [Arthrobacter phage Molivia]|jgi:hypothetical protein|uniref:Uncharacterized protein n=1 Tax=Arthrobacter phage Molivia TaxID=2015839 RepID=A0A286S1S9_9CAUD|nr:hypothetical protein FDI28_gp81 [Arthrobacter phage Molivia]ASX99257.1 hypothetical protein SEA_MOLIVIA_33 [Arthrobacter phage Molivia]
MAGVKRKSAPLKTVMKQFTGSVSDRLNTRSKETAIRAGIAAQQAMRDTIMSTPSGINPNKPDRYDTGNMFNKVTHSTSFRHQRFTVRFGWLYNHKQYFLTQEHGGMAFGKFQITGMFALRNGLRAAQQVLEEGLTKEMRKK